MVALLSLIGAVSLIDRSIILVMIPEIKADLGISDAQFGLIQGLSFGVAYTCFALISGMLVDRSPRHLLLSLSLAVWTLAAAACGLAQSFAQLLLSRVVVGVGESTASPAAQSIIGDLFAKERLAAPVSVYMSMGAISTGISVALGGWLLNLFTVNPHLLVGGLVPWRQVLIVSALPGLALMLVILMVREPRRTVVDGGGAKPPSWAAYGAFVRECRPAFWGLVAGYALCGLAAYGALAWGPTYARRVLGMSPQQVGESLGLIFGVGTPLFTILLGTLADFRVRAGHYDFPLKLMMIVLAIALPLGVAGFLIKSVPLYYVAMFALQCGIVGAVGQLLAALQMISPPNMRGRSGAVTLIASSVGAYAGGSFIIGFLTDYLYQDDQAVGYSIATVVAVAAPVAIIFLQWSRRSFVRRLESLRQLDKATLAG
ncbi:hypothetical protein BSL82_11705 [Tardibacter chloracetimidivorans]|uniref:Major facilitator superfamily (MFS) profile domain-containing protein n=2 Tax=Tardibacter chloracetimidivorans TaxID=1921510 RepID=A0A1L3ZW89_9SPHN|nr:hypothetical protein BSL82_11705 [Tardibacter chloracetimidivorans]